MALKVNRKELDEFCPMLFRTLDHLGGRLLPMSLSAKPNEFEKYARRLFGFIRRTNDVAAGFKEWESQVLREASFGKVERYPELELLRQWMTQEQHAALFTNKANLQHLHTSLYSRVFEYLYPRRVLANAYCIKHQGNSFALEEDFLDTAFPISVEAEVQKLSQTFSGEWDVIVTDTRASLIANRHYYSRVLAGKETLEPEEQEFEPEELEENTEEA